MCFTFKGPRPPYKPDDPRYSNKDPEGYLPPVNKGKIVPQPPSYAQVIQPTPKPTFKPNYEHNDNFVIKKVPTTKVPLTYIPPSSPKTVPIHVPANPTPQLPIKTIPTTQPKVPAITINTERPVKGITKVPTGNIIKPKTPAPTPAPTPYKPIPTQPPHFVNTYNPKPIVPIEPIRPTISVPAYKPSTPRPFEPAPTNRPTARPPIYNEPKTTPIVNKNVTPHPSPPFHVPSYPPSSETCVCNADKPHSSKPTYTSSSSYPNSNPASVDFNKQFTGFNGNPNFGSIMNAMSLTQLPVVPQAPGLPAFYPPDKIPKGAVIAFMPVVILPQEYYANCDDNAIRSPSKYQTVDPFPLGVQPATIPNSFSVHSIFSGAGPKDQCMCPCSCTQNLDKYHKKREINAADAPEVKATVEEPAKAVEPIAEASSPVEVKAEAPVAAAATPVEAKVEAPVAEASSDVEVKVKAPVAEASTPAEVKVEAPIAEASTPVEVKVEAPVAEASTPVEVKVEAPVAAAEKSIATATITKVEPVAESATN